MYFTSDTAAWPLVLAGSDRNKYKKKKIYNFDASFSNMQEEHRKAIQKNFVSLVERTDLDVMVSALYEKGVFSEQMIEPYYDTNKDARTRKRLLYSDITRRGPRAFGHLLDALSEAGYWDLVRELDPHSALHFRPRSPISLKSDESNFVSIRNERQKTKHGVDTNKNPVKDRLAPAPRDITDLSDPLEIPKFNVVKSTKFFEETGKDLQLYRTRGWNRGYLVVFSYIQFDNNTDEHRPGADVDCQNLKYLFAELGMKVASYQNLTKKETLETLRMLQDGCVSDGECLFIVVSSHGYERRGSSDVDVRCSDGGIVSIYDFIGNFNDKNFPALQGIPKVFIFQLCRGSNSEWMGSGVLSDGMGRPPAPGGLRDPPPQLVDLPRPQRDRMYNDILVAHSTLPGHVSHRDPVEGSWYIQALCEVFAARAHDCHVEKLFTLVDKRLHQRFQVQTSVTENWGFSRRLYLHPGLHEGPPPAPPAAHHASPQP